MSIIKRSFTRKKGFRDANLIIIASENTFAEKIYFEALTTSKEFSNPFVEVEVINEKGLESSPDKAIKALDEFKKTYIKEKDDELWLLIDFDRWGTKKLAQINKLCKQKGYNLAVSNKCFEIWLLLHLRGIDEFKSSEIEEFKLKCDNIEKAIRKILGSFNKTKFDPNLFLGGVYNAIERASAIDIPNNAWPVGLGTKVFVVTKKILDRK